MPTNDFQAVANTAGATILTQAQYLAFLAANPTGWPSGIVPATRMNKTIRQSSVIAAAVAQFVSNALAADVLDPDGGVAVATIAAQILAAIQAIAPQATTGDAKLTLKTAADAGWIIVNDGSIGNVASNATTRNNADTANLFALVWNNVINTWAPTQTSAGAPVARGGSAAADYAANRRIVIPLVLGRAIAICGAGAGLTSRALGQVLGEEAHTPIVAEMYSHSHGIKSQNDALTGGTDTILNAGAGVGAFTEVTGSSTPFNVMQPSSFLNIMLKL